MAEQKKRGFVFAENGCFCSPNDKSLLQNQVFQQQSSSQRGRPHGRKEDFFQKNNIKNATHGLRNLTASAI